MEKQTTFRKLAVKPVDKWTQEDRDTIKQACQELGIEMQNCNCPNKFVDQTHIILKVLADKEVAKNLVKTKRKLFLRPNLHVLFNGRRVSAETIKTDKQIQELLADNFPKSLIYTKEQIAEVYGIKLNGNEEEIATNQETDQVE